MTAPLHYSPSFSLLSAFPLPSSFFTQCGPDTMPSGSCPPCVFPKSLQKLWGNGYCVLSLILDWPYCGSAGYQRDKSGVLHCPMLQMKKSVLPQRPTLEASALRCSKREKEMGIWLIINAPIQLSNRSYTPC